ncbi:MAG: hypothetical protein AAGA69_11535 [Pseudomonadota bacterium]
MKKSHWKLIAAILLDVLDFTVGRIVGLGTVMDLALGLIGFALFGWKGLFQLWELVDVTDQADGFVPTLTLIALAEMREESKRAKSSPEQQ